MDFKELSNGKTASKLYTELTSKYNLSHVNILEYLFTLHLIEPSINKAEKRLLKFLHLGTNGERITKSMIRGVDKNSVKKGVKILNADSCETAFNKYRKQIILHNKKIA